MNNYPYQNQSQNVMRVQDQNWDPGQAQGAQGLLAVPGQQPQNFNSMKDYKGEPLLPPPHIQQQYMNMMGGNDNVPAGPPSNSQGSAGDFQKARSFGQNGAPGKGANEMAMID